MKVIKYWTSHTTTDSHWWMRNLALDAAKYQLVFDPISPDYLLATEHIYVDCVARAQFRRLYSPRRIAVFWAGECISPDMNVFDYATTFDKEMRLFDRIIRRPIVPFFGWFLKEDLSIARDGAAALQTKTDFCNFIYANPKAHPRRDEMFKELSKYKHIHSLGPHLNNCGTPTSREALDFEMQSVAMKKPFKFSIAAENASFRGYTSEKIMTSFLARSVPIYWGDPEIATEFNPRAFINANGMSNEELLFAVRKVDEDNDLWIDMVSAAPMTVAQRTKMIRDEENYKIFMNHIFECPISEARRRPEGFWTDNYLRAFFSNPTPVYCATKIAARYFSTKTRLGRWLLRHI